MASRLLVDLEARTLHRAHPASRQCVAEHPHPAAASARHSRDPTHTHAGRTGIIGRVGNQFPLTAPLDTNASDPYRRRSAERSTSLHLPCVGQLPDVLSGPEWVRPEQTTPTRCRASTREGT